MTESFMHQQNHIPQPSSIMKNSRQQISGGWDHSDSFPGLQRYQTCKARK